MAIRKRATKTATKKAPASKGDDAHKRAVVRVRAQMRAKSSEDLADELLTFRKEQFALRMQRATGQSVKPDQFGKVRRNIARLKTILREKQVKA